MNQDISSQFLPDELENSLLRAAMSEGSDALDAWRNWSTGIDLDDIGAGSLQIVPLLYKNLSGMGVQHELMGKYKGIYRYFWAQSQKVIKQTKPVVVELTTQGIPFLLIKGAAFRDVYYPDPFTRTFADLDLMVPESRYDETTSVFRENGVHVLDPRGGGLVSIRHAALFSTSSGVKIDLHWHLLHQCCYEGADDSFWSGAVPFDYQGVSCHTLNATDSLLHILVHGANLVEPKQLRWVCDAHFILKHGEIDWQRFTALCDKLKLAPLVTTTCRYLQRQFDMPIPNRVVENINGMRCSEDRTRELSLYASPRGALSAIPLLWYGYLDQHPGVTGLGKYTGFLGHLEQWCGVDSVFGLARFMFSQVRQRIKVRLRERQFAHFRPGW